MRSFSILFAVALIACTQVQGGLCGRDSEERNFIEKITYDGLPSYKKATEVPEHVLRQYKDESASDIDSENELHSASKGKGKAKAEESESKTKRLGFFARLRNKVENKLEDKLDQLNDKVDRSRDAWNDLDSVEKAARLAKFMPGKSHFTVTETSYSVQQSGNAPPIVHSSTKEYNGGKSSSQHVGGHHQQSAFAGSSRLSNVGTSNRMFINGPSLMQQMQRDQQERWNEMHRRQVGMSNGIHGRHEDLMKGSRERHEDFMNGIYARNDAFFDDGPSFGAFPAPRTFGEEFEEARMDAEKAALEAEMDAKEAALQAEMKAEEADFEAKWRAGRH